MKTYILTIVGAAVLSSFASVLSPDKWRKYVGVITGLVIISCIIAPIAKISRTDLFAGFEAIENSEEYNENLQREIVCEEFAKRIGTDISLRLKDEFGINASARAEVNINEKNEITGIKKISVKGGKLTAEAKARLCAVYGISEDKIENE